MTLKNGLVSVISDTPIVPFDSFPAPAPWADCVEVEFDGPPHPATARIKIQQSRVRLAIAGDLLRKETNGFANVECPAI